VPVTLAQAQINTQTDIDYSVIDNLRRYSWLFDHIVWDDTVTPGTGGGSLSYGWTLLTTTASAAFRAINQEYTPAQATRSQKSVNLKPMGGAFNVDRVLANLGQASTNEVSFQMQQLLTATRTNLQKAIILGDSAVDVNGFDGLNKLLTGTNTEYIPATGASAVQDAANNILHFDPAVINTQANANLALDFLDDFLSTIVPSHVGGGDQGEPGALPAGVKAILGNTKSITRIRALARWAAMFTSTKDDLGREIQMYGDWVLIDIGDLPDGSAPIIPIQTRSVPGAVTGLTDIYAVTFGLDSFHGATTAGTPLVQTWLPDFSIAGAVKTGELEIGPGALVIKNTRASGVLRNVKVL
jgi:hypothetical protein